MVAFFRSAAAILLAASVVAAQKCSAGSKCPASSPCCSSYGDCGTGAYCLGGCDPTSSFNLQSCMPNPTCKSGNFAFKSTDDISPNTQYLGDADKYNWVSSGTPAIYQGQSMLLTMAPNTVGTLVSSTHYVWYGKISANMTTSQGQGVVTAFILMSDVKDEIDFEFVGVDLSHAQSNFYFQGITNYQNGKNLSTANTMDFHNYEIDWQPDQLTWSVDGKVLRTLKKSDTYNETDKLYHYPQTPSRVQLSLWPAGLPSNGQGTIDWAGGLINWNSPLMTNGYYYAQVNSVSVQCYNPPSGAKVSGSKSYTYNNVLGTENTVVTGNDNTVLASFQANGNNQQLGAKPSGSSTSSAAGAQATANENTVPGMTGTGSYGNDASANNGGSGNAAAGGSTGTGGGSVNVIGGMNGQFVQGGTSTSSNDGSRTIAGSVVALVAFIAAAMMI